MHVHALADFPRKQDFPRNSLRASGAPRIALSGSGKPPTRPPLVFPLLYMRTLPLYYPARAGIPNYTEGVITPSPGRPESSESPTWASAAVTGTFHTLPTVFLRLRRTLPDSVDLPPGLYVSIMDPSHKSHNRRTIQPLDTHLASYGNMYTTMCQFRTTNTRNSD